MSSCEKGWPKLPYVSAWAASSSLVNFWAWLQYIVLPLPPLATLCFDELLELGVVRGQFFRREIHVVANCFLLADLELALGL